MASKREQKTAQRLIRILSEKRFSFIRAIQATHKTAEVYLVGGSVRDVLIGRPIKDFDFVVRGISLKKTEDLLRPLGAMNLVGRTFGVIKFSPTSSKKTSTTRAHVIDIALPRTEHSEYHTGHYRDFFVKSDWRLPIQDDLSRRDFTINAIAFDCVRREFIDPFGGIQDCTKKIIRCVGKPSDRFREDYSRMLRALRFSCQLNFSLDGEVVDALTELFPKINKKIRAPKNVLSPKDLNALRVVPYEVLARELCLTIISHPLRAIELFETFGVFATLMPQVLVMKGCPQPPLWHSEGDVWTHTKLCIQALLGRQFKKEFGASPLEPLLLWAVLFHDIGKPLALKTPEKDGVDRIRFDGHDRMGADCAREIAETLRLHSVQDMHISSEDLWWLINYHLVMLNTDLKLIKHTTLEKYFFRDARRGLLLRQLIFVDSLGSKRADGKTSLGSYRALKRRLKNYEKIFHQKNRLPPAIVNGDEIMRALHLSPSPLVGDFILQVREEQLARRITTKKGALDFLKKKAKKK